MDDLVVIGGLVPSLLIDQLQLPSGVERHVGTLDLDLGLTVALLDERRYQTLTERLRRAGFQPDVNESGNLTRQRWAVTGTAGRVTIEFLIPPSLPTDRGGTLRNIENDFAAVIAPGLRLAFLDRRAVRLTGATIFGEQATREVWVCGPGAYVVLKALAFANRGENKDAYDLYYVVRNYGTSVADLLPFLTRLLDEPEAQEAIAVLRRDFLVHDAIGPRRTAEFIFGSRDDATQADVVSFVAQLLALCAKR